MYDNVIKENIRRFRKAKGYTQAEMAEILDISVTAYRSIESGDTVLLKHIIEDIARVFEVGVESILTKFRKGKTHIFPGLEDEAASYMEKKIADWEKTNDELAQCKLKISYMESKMKEQEKHIADLQGTIRILKKAKGFDDSEKI